MKLTVWGRPNSSNVKKVLWTLDELALDYRLIPLGGKFGGLDDEKYHALNPNGLVPTLKDGNLVLWESNTIVRYLAARYGHDTLWIADCGRRAQAEKWMDWTTSTIFKPFQQILYNAIRWPQDKRDSAQLTRGIQDFEDGLAVLEAGLVQKTWLSGENFGIGDIIPGVFVYYYYSIAITRQKRFAKVEDWYRQLQSRDAYRKNIMTPIT